MTSHYSCKKCLYKTNYFNDIKRHFTKKKKCMKNLDSFSYSDDQIVILSFTPYFDNMQNIKSTDLDQYKDTDILYKNIIELISIIESIDKHRLKKCMYCNSEFNKICDLRQHILMTCFYNKKVKETQQSISIVGTNNNININLEIKTPVPFDEAWNISQIMKEKKTDLTFSHKMYTNLLIELLQNEINLNVIIDNEQTSGIVYKNNIEKYIHMKSKDIAQNTMEKLKNHLEDFNKNNTHTIPEIIDLSNKNITEKYNNYKNNEHIQNCVDKLICDIFKNKKNESINIAKQNNGDSEILKKAGY